MYVICPQKRHVIFYISSIPFPRKMEENIQEYMSLYLLDWNITENNTKKGKVFWFCPKSWGNDEKSPYVSIFSKKYISDFVLHLSLSSLKKIKSISLPLKVLLWTNIGGSGVYIMYWTLVSSLSHHVSQT